MTVPPPLVGCSTCPTGMAASVLNSGIMPQIEIPQSSGSLGYALNFLSNEVPLSVSRVHSQESTVATISPFETHVFWVAPLEIKHCLFTHIHITMALTLSSGNSLLR